MGGKGELPIKWKRPKQIFVNSMSDLFHPKVPDEFIFRVFETMKTAHWHRFQILTKRSKRLVKLAQELPWSKNIWQGVTIENKRVAQRIDDLRQVPSAVRFVSCEPLLSSLNGLDFSGIDWIIVGGESGPGARPMRPEWVEGIKRMCEESGTPFFFKQWGGVRKHKAGRLLEGRTWDEMPAEKQRMMSYGGVDTSGINTGLIKI